MHRNVQKRHVEQQPAEAAVVAAGQASRRATALGRAASRQGQTRHLLPAIDNHHQRPPPVGPVAECVIIKRA